MTFPVLQFQRVCKAFAQPDMPLRVLDEVDLDLAPGHSMALLGESGSGKTTLLYLAAGLAQPDAGHILLDGDRLDCLSPAGLARLRRQKLGFVFQQFHLVHTLCVQDNIRFQAALGGKADRDFESRLIDSLNLGEQLRKYPSELSGGQQQRVAVARALLPRPRLVLADEPTGSLDEASSREVLHLLLQLVKEAEAALLLVTHSQKLAAQLDITMELQGGHLSRHLPQNV